MDITAAWRRRLVGIAVVASTMAMAMVGQPTVAAQPTTEATSTAKNVVMILADDFSTDLLPYMSELRSMMDNGVSFDNYYVTNSLCCPSRASILTGKFPHNTGVLKNGGDLGGITAFRSAVGRDGMVHDNEDSTYATQAQDRGYYTMLEGKYLNGYNNKFTTGNIVRRPAGWSMWRPYGAGAYAGYSFPIGVPNAPAVANTRYSTDQIIDRASKFIPTMKSRGTPFHMTLSTFATHAGNLVNPELSSFPPARRDSPKTATNPQGEFTNGDCGRWLNGTRRNCHSIKIESLPGNENINCPTARDSTEIPYAKPDGRDDACELQQYLRDRIRMAQALDELIGEVRRQLTANGLWSSTYLVFTSDNGFHLGQGIDLGLIEDGAAGFRIGKGSPYETDLRVPLVIEGADSAQGVVRTELTQSVDLVPTFAAMQPTTNGSLSTITDHDGMNLLPLIRGEQVSTWRNWAYSVHTRVADVEAAGPDSEPGTMVREGFFALRSAGELYVRHVDGDDRGRITRYSIVDSPNGRTNTAREWDALPEAKQQAVLHQFDAFAGCGGGEASLSGSCQAAARAAQP